MSDEATTSSTSTRSAFLWIGGIMLVIMAATITAFIVVVLFGGNDDTPASDEPITTPTVAVSVRDLALRSAPDGATAIVSRVSTGDPVSILGRNDEGDWLLVAPDADPGVEGWIPADGIDPVPPTRRDTALNCERPGCWNGNPHRDQRPNLHARPA